MKFPKSCKVIMYFNRFFEITQFQNESQKSFLRLNFLMSHKRLVFTWKKNFQEVIHPQIFFVIYLYQDASAKRIFKQKNSLADLMHSPNSKSDHSGGGKRFRYVCHPSRLFHSIPSIHNLLLPYFGSLITDA